MVDINVWMNDFLQKLEEVLPVVFGLSACKAVMVVERQQRRAI